MKRCNGCERDLSRDDFHRSASNADGLVYRCKECVHAYGRRRYAEHSERVLLTNRCRSYGLSVDRYLELTVEQDGKCASCREVPDKALVIDHCHSGGHVRGLLCHSCNLALGHMQDDPYRLRSAARYLEAASAVA